MLKSSSIGGFGIIESLISIMLLTFLMVGGMSVYMYSNDYLKGATHKRMAADLANSQMEWVKQQGYGGNPSLSSCITNTSQVGFLPATVTTCKSSLLNDGSTYGNYTHVNVTVQWTQPGQSSSSNVILDSFIAQ